VFSRGTIIIIAASNLPNAMEIRHGEWLKRIGTFIRPFMLRRKRETDCKCEMVNGR